MNLKKSRLRRLSKKSKLHEANGPRLGSNIRVPWNRRVGLAFCLNVFHSPISFPEIRFSIFHSPFSTMRTSRDYMLKHLKYSGLKELLGWAEYPLLKPAPNICGVWLGQVREFPASKQAPWIELFQLLSPKWAKRLLFDQTRNSP